MTANIYVLQTHCLSLTSLSLALISHFSTLPTYVFNLLQIHRYLKANPCLSKLSFLCSLVHFTCPQVNSSPN